MFFYIAFRSKIGCRGKNEYQYNRRELKTQSRPMNMVFGSLLVTLTVCLIVSFILETTRDECQNDERYESMLIPALISLCLVTIYGVFLATLTSV